MSYEPLSKKRCRLPRHLYVNGIRSFEKKEGERHVPRQRAVFFCTYVTTPGSSRVAARAAARYLSASVVSALTAAHARAIAIAAAASAATPPSHEQTVATERLAGRYAACKAPLMLAMVPLPPFVKRVASIPKSPSAIAINSSVLIACLSFCSKAEPGSDERAEGMRGRASGTKYKK